MSASRVQLITTYYRTPHAERNAELDTVLSRNLHEATSFDDVHIVVERGDDAAALQTLLAKRDTHATPRVRVHVVDGRPTFRGMFAVAHRALLSTFANGGGRDDSSNVVSVVANADIFFTRATLDALRAADDLRHAKAFYCLTRWDVEQPVANNDGASPPAKLYDVPWSQDTWVWRGAPRAALLDGRVGAYALGNWGCDNRLAHELCHIAGYTVHNPARRIITYHLHRGGPTINGHTGLHGWRPPSRSKVPPPYMDLPPRE